MNYFRNANSKLYDVVSEPVEATGDALVKRLQSVHDSVSLLYRKMKERLGYGETLKEIVEEEAKKEHKEEHEEDQEQQQDNIDLTLKELERALKGAYKSFR